MTKEYNRFSFKIHSSALLLFSLLFIAGLVSGCKKLVDVGLPSNQLVAQSVYNDNILATGAMTNIYTDMCNNSNLSYNIAVTTGISGDELEYRGNDAGIISFYQNHLDATSGSGDVSFSLTWGNLYSYVFQVNSLLENLPGSPGVSPAVKKQLVGEAQFVRAFCFFYLTNYFGDVPLVISTDYNINGKIARSSRTDVYKQIFTDLRNAEVNLNVNFVDGTDTAATTDRVRPTKWAALALEARAYLYTGHYDSAIAKASAVIANAGTFSLEADLNKVFLTTSREAIWQLAVPTPGNATINTRDGNFFILTSMPADNQVVLSRRLLNIFEANDKRRIYWVDSFMTTTPSDTFYFPYKYKVNVCDPGNITEYTMVFRLAEQYLIRAEAKAMNGDVAGAIVDLNAIRQRAGLGNYPANTTDQKVVLAAITRERQAELFTEWGNRWFDLIRTNQIGAVMGTPGNVCQQKGGVWDNDNHQELFPIPQRELLYDHNMTQNPGYN